MRTSTRRQDIAPTTSTSLSRKSQDTEWPKRHKARSNETPRERIIVNVNGTVKFFNYARGFGFIAPDNGEKDVFVHTSALPQSGVPALKEGDKVSFETEDDTRGRGKKAAKVELF